MGIAPGGKLAVHTWQPVDYADGLVRVGVQSAISHPEAGALLRKLLTEQRRMEDELRDYAKLTAHDLRVPIMSAARFTELLARPARGRRGGRCPTFALRRARRPGGPDGSG